MISHQPTPEQLERLQQAQIGASQTDAAVAEARAKLALALAEHSEASMALTKAIHDVIYGPQGKPVTYSAEHGPELRNGI
ncbi:hypothetical protein PV383_44085 [Streptomyces caniscabiei]|uniref:Uncharacterized protein n=1 Tax=Streptomyces caniscabiei TaxID=2746961 RepID=A0ABU4N2T7_9ACTN|nr:hypothetical protein [Streptomyces caniscabiei]MDX3044095.1 hypothetical protein [Streptomyces caniscabiei]